MKAPDGQVYVCAACGKHAKDRMEIGDVSCYLNAVLCYEEKQMEDGRMVWMPVPKDTEEA